MLYLGIDNFYNTTFVLFLHARDHRNNRFRVILPDGKLTPEWNEEMEKGLEETNRTAKWAQVRKYWRTAVFCIVLWNVGRVARQGI